MGSILKSIGLTALTISTLLALAIASLYSLKSNIYAMFSEDAAVQTIMRPSLGETAWIAARLFPTCCVLGVIWAAVIVVPSVVAARRLFSTSIARRLFPVVFVVVISAVAFGWPLTPTGNLPSILVFFAGGAIGLAATGVADWTLPPDKSPKRIHEI